MPAEAAPNLTGLSLEPPCAAQSGDPPRIGTSAAVPLPSIAGKHRKNMAAQRNFILTCLQKVKGLKHGVLEACAVSLDAQNFLVVSLQRQGLLTNMNHDKTLLYPPWQWSFRESPGQRSGSLYFPKKPRACQGNSAYGPKGDVENHTGKGWACLTMSPP